MRGCQVFLERDVILDLGTFRFQPIPIRIRPGRAHTRGSDMPDIGVASAPAHLIACRYYRRCEVALSI